MRRRRRKRSVVFLLCSPMRPELPADVGCHNQTDTTSQAQARNVGTRIGSVRCVITARFESTTNNLLGRCRGGPKKGCEDVLHQVRMWVFGDEEPTRAGRDRRSRRCKRRDRPDDRAASRCPERSSCWKYCGGGREEEERRQLGVWVLLRACDICTYR